MENQGEMMKSDIRQGVMIRKPGENDAGRLSKLATEAFCLAYAGDMSQDDINLYVRANFYEERVKKEMNDPEKIIFMILDQEKPAGYSCLGIVDVPPCVSGVSVIQLSQFYLLPAAKGTGAANLLMKKTLDEAITKGYDTVWLSCWERNPRAISFYKRWQFKAVGRQEFVVGNDVQQDIIFQKNLVSKI
jgi:ribosomal protein S18 acetylase RimI-like enzyme